MKLRMLSIILILQGLIIEGMHLSVPNIPKTASQRSLIKAGKKKSKKIRTRKIANIDTETQIMAACPDDQDALNDVRIAAAMRHSLNEMPLMRDFKESVESMSSLSDTEKWRLLGLMKKFDETAQEDSKDCDNKLRHISRQMSSLDSETHHAHAPKSKHKRGDSF